MAFTHDSPPDSTRFFARIRSLDLECPACSTLYRATGAGGPYNRRTGLFRCQNTKCNLVLYIGVIAYPATRTRYQDRTPADWVPTLRQAAHLRLFSGRWATHAQPPTARRNVAVRGEGCRCQVSGTGFLVHPACPVHGSGGGSQEG